MKKTILLATGIALPLFIFSQIGFQKFYGRPSTFQEIRAIVPMADGGYLLGGTNGATNGNGNDFWIVKTDSLGNEEWEKEFGDSNYNNLWVMAKTIDNSYLLGGQNFANLSQNIDGQIMKLDGNFNLLWNINLGTDTTSEFITKIIPSPDNGCIALLRGTYNYNGNASIYSILRIDEFGNILWSYDTFDCLTDISMVGTDDIFLFGSKNASAHVFNLDIDGNLIWEKEIINFQSTPNSTLSPNGITDLNNSGGIVLSGTSDYKQVLTKIDYTGELIWQVQGSDSYNSYNAVLIELPDGRIASIHLSGITVHSESGDLLEAETFFNNIVKSFKDGVLFDSKFALVGVFANPDNGTDGGMAIMDMTLDIISQKGIGDFLPSGNETSYNFVKDVDGGYVLAGEASFVGKKNDFYVIKTDASGEVVWESNYGGLNTDLLKNITRTAENGFILSGMEQPFNNLLLKKIDSEGALVWESSYNVGSEWYSWTPSVELNDGSIMVAYSWFGGQYVLKFDSDGNFLSESNHQSLKIEDAILSADGNFVSVGQNLTYFDGVIYKCDSDGNTIYYKSIDIGSSSSWGRMYSIKQLGSGDFIATGILFGDPDHSLYLVRLNNDAELIWSQFFNLGVDEYSYPVLNIASDSLFIISVNADGFIQILKTNSEGELQWYQNSEPETGTTIFDAEIIDNANIALFGTDYDSKNSDFTLISLLLDSGITDVNVRFLGDLSIYPNPSNNDLSINFGSPYLGPIEISIISSSGQRLRHFKEEKSNTMFQGNYQLDDLPPGAYFVRLTAGGRSITRTWIKQ